MAEEAAPEVADANITATEDTEVKNKESAHNAGENGGLKPNGADSATNGNTNQKQSREEEESEESKDGDSKKQKVEKSVEEERLEKLEEGMKEENISGPVNLGPKVFGSSVEMFDYLYKLLHYWTPYLNINKVLGNVKTIPRFQLEISFLHALNSLSKDITGLRCAGLAEDMCRGKRGRYRR